MADIVIGRNADNLDISDKFDGYTRVVIKTGETDAEGNDIAYVSGNDSGRTLEITNPWGNQTVADNILAKIQGWAYQPLTADGASINPAFEVGDSIVVNDVFSGVYSSRVKFSRLFLADVEAPVDKEIDHEYEFEDSRERKYTRKINEAVARLNFFADSIEAKVDKVNENATFGWRLTENGWSVFNQNGNLFSVDANGASVTGEIKANSGIIGGFTIGSNGISTNSQTYGGEETNGIYIGVNGIQLGTRFRVDSQGNLYAGNGTFDGNIYAKNIRYGGDYGTLSGGAISPWSLDTGQFAQGVRNSLGFADLFNSATVRGGSQYPNYFHADTVAAETGMLSPEYYVYDAQNNAAGSLKRHTHFITVSGNTVTLGAPDFTGTNHSFSVAPSSAQLDQAWDEGFDYACDRARIQIREGGSWGDITTYTIYISVNGVRYNDLSCYVNNGGTLHW